MLIHIANDEKFIDIAFRIFEEVYPNQNECIVFSESKELNFIKSTPCSVVNTKDVNIKNLTASFQKYDAIILHSLHSSMFEVIKHIPQSIVIVWLGFGYDYYDLIVKNNTDLFDLKTRKLFLLHYRKLNLVPMFIRDDCYAVIPILKKMMCLIFRQIDKRQLINKINFFAPVLKEEFKMIQAVSHQKFKPKFINWNYGTLEDDLIRGYEKNSLSSNNILVGNSAHYENNHLEAFDLLTKFNIRNRKVITPLSYGIPIYRDEILSNGTKLFKKNYMPLVTFIPIDEYINIIRSCSVVIMNHIRQQALGNIITMIFLGATVFLKRTNPIYKFLKKEGAIILSIEELNNNANLINFRLSQNEIQKNREILKLHWSRKITHQNTKTLIKTLKSATKGKY